MDDELRNNNEATGNNEANDNIEAFKAMSDEEIRAAAENIGATPFVGYGAAGGNSAGQNSSYTANSDSADNTEKAGFTSYTDYDYSASGRLNDTPHVKKKRHIFAKLFKFIGLAACFGAIAGGTFYGVTYGMNKAFGDSSFLTAANAESGDTTVNALKQLGVSNLVIAASSTTTAKRDTGNVVVDVVKENMSSTVCVGISYTMTQRDIWTGRTSSYEVQGGGSGFIVGMNDDEIFIATNNHVVEKAEKITITFSDDETVSATTRATDASNDLAIVSVKKADVSKDTLNEIKVATLGDSDESQVGEMVIAIGNALGYGQSVTVGYLSAKDRTVNYESASMTLLQTDAAINEGNSGGPLFNVNGEVIGINCAKYSDESVEGMCFAIPISAAIPILDDLINREIVAEEDRGYLGVVIQTVTEDLANLLGMPYGVRVQSVTEDSAAAEAGIYTGDVITAVNGTKVTTNEQLIAQVNSYKYGVYVRVTFQRQINGKWTEMFADVKLMKRPSTN